jgi:hypothetical protein
MRLVYEKAMRVVAWLGEADESTELVVELVQSLKEQNITQEAVSASLQDTVTLRESMVRISSVEKL